MWVLTYHSISQGPRPLCIARDRFAAQLDGLLDAGWQPVPVGEIFSRAAPDRPARPRFAVSFDDGYRDFAHTAFPVLEQRGIPATLFVPAAVERTQLPGGLEGRALLDPSELRDLAARGVEIGAHGIDHQDLTRLDDGALARELRVGRERLCEWIGRPVRYLAYPFGAFDARVLATAGSAYAGAFTTQLGAVPPVPHPHAVPRIDAYYLDDPRLVRAARRGNAARYLMARRWLRRLRGSEPRRPIPTAPAAHRRAVGRAPAWR